MALFVGCSGHLNGCFPCKPASFDSVCGGGGKKDSEMSELRVFLVLETPQHHVPVITMQCSLCLCVCLCVSCTCALGTVTLASR